jgi:hypothetical protein
MQHDRKLEASPSSATAYDDAILPAIMSLTWRYAYAIDSRNVDLVASLFSREATFGHWGLGPSAAAEFYRSIWTRFSRSIHSVTNHIVTRHDDRSASGIVYCASEQEIGDEWVSSRFAYADHYIFEDDVWRFKRRSPQFWFRETSAGRVLAAELPPGRAGSLPEAWPTWSAYWKERSAASDSPAASKPGRPTV